MTTLIDIGDEFRTLAALLDELPDGEMTPEVAVTLDGWFAELEDAKEQKIDGYAAYYRNLKLMVAVRQAEIDRLQKWVDADKNKMEWLKDRLQLFMEMTGQKKIVTDRARITVCANGGKVPVDVLVDPHQLPARFQRVRVEANTDTIREALEAGEKWDDFARLKPRGNHLRIT